MRISTALMQSLGLNTLLDQQAKLSKTQLQISRGERYLTPADNPQAAARTLELDQALAVAAQYRTNAEAASARLGLTEDHLAALGDLLVRARELAVKANNDTQTAETRGYIAKEARELVDTALALANARDANGEYLFAGNRTLGAPFARAAGGFSYSGDDGQRFLEVGPATRVAVGDSGTAVFRAIRNGNGTFSVRAATGNTGSGVVDAGRVLDATSWAPASYTLTFTSATTFQINGAGAYTYTPGATIRDVSGIEFTIQGNPAPGDQFIVAPSVNQDLFSTLESLVTALEMPDSDSTGRTAFHNRINGFLTDLDQAQAHLLDVRASLGARLSAIEQQAELNDGYVLQLEQTRSLLNDLDLAEAVGRLNLQLTALEAAQQVFLRVQGLSLFNLLR